MKDTNTRIRTAVGTIPNPPKTQMTVLKYTAQSYHLAEKRYRKAVYNRHDIEFRFTSFAQFLKLMGPRPMQHKLVRINPDGHFEPGNTAWALDEIRCPAVRLIPSNYPGYNPAQKFRRNIVRVNPYAPSDQSYTNRIETTMHLPTGLDSNQIDWS